MHDVLEIFWRRREILDVGTWGLRVFADEVECQATSSEILQTLPALKIS